MKLAGLYDSVGKLEGPASADGSRLEFANTMVRDLLDEYVRLETYEQKYSPSFKDEADDERAAEVLKSIGRMFGSWLEDARAVFEKVKQLPDVSRKHSTV